MFSASELINRHGLINYSGFDYLGNKLGNDVRFDDFFTSRDANGRRTFVVAPQQPIYGAVFLQDKFSYKDIIFRLGLRMDYFDANTKVMRDPYALYEIETAKDYYARKGLEKPESVGDDFNVYVTDEENDNVRAFRKGDQWFLPNGTAVSGGNIIYQGGLVYPSYAGKDEQGKQTRVLDIQAPFKDGQQVYKTEYSLYDALTKMPRNGLAAVSKQLPGYLRQASYSPSGTGEAGLIDGAWLPLSRVFRHQPNPLTQETGLLQLALALGRLFAEKSPDPAAVTPFTINVQCDKWDLINDPNLTGRLSLEIEPGPMDAVGDPRYRAPEWCQKKFSWMYAIGRLLRAAATGELDFTSRQWVLREETGRYTGIRSTWQKRRLGMMHAATALGGTTTPITPWFSELLLKLLQWPGIVADADLIPEFDGIDSPQRFVRFIEDRLRAQAGIYGKSSGLPIYAYPVEWRLDNEKGFRVALVQGLMPSEMDFTKTEGKLYSDFVK